ncbi:O-antigen ligase family protein [Deinococcus irradiatisoli]|uniref:O-antigen ligase family protein n=1 Tax=Deinococcus irradiatisoli TaxID=2202254 RepID=UPI0015E86121|nr:O-antigen ligase family protein [Deinococcus irradiatisoli]
MTLILTFAVLKPFIENVAHLIPNTPISATVLQVLLCLWALVLVVSRHSLKSVFNANLLPILLMAGYLWYSLGWSYDVKYGSDKWQFWLINAALPAAAIYGLLTQAKQQIDWSFFLFFAAIFGVVTLVFGNGDRNSIDGLNVIWTSRIALTSLTVVLFAPLRLWIRAPLVVLFALVAFSAESRGPVLSFVVPVGLYLLWDGLRRGLLSRRHSVGVMAVGLFGFIPAMLGLFWFLDHLNIITDSRYFAILTNGAADDGVNTRAELINTAIRSFQAHPIFGEGLGGFSRYFPQYYPHNVFAEVACETGLVGLSLLLAVLLRAVRAFSRQHIMLVLLFIQCFGYALFSGAISSNPEYFLMYAVLTGTVLAAANATTVLEPIARRRRSGRYGQMTGDQDLVPTD